MNVDLLPAVKSLDDIKDQSIRKEFDYYANQKHVLGILLWGSRATRFGQPDTDWDALIYVEQKFFDSLKKTEIAILKFDESVKPRKMIIDFTFWADSIFKDQLTSPMDIDHSAYIDAVVLLDKTGKLEAWRKKLAYYDEKEHKNRLKAKWINTVVASQYVFLNDRRGNTLDMQVNYAKTLACCVDLWFCLQHTWARPLKWWSKQVKQLGMTEETFTVFEKAMQENKSENLKKVMDHLQELVGKEIDIKNFVNDFFETIYPQGRFNLIKHGYI